MATTFDNVVVKRENFGRLVEAMRQFQAELPDNLKHCTIGQQADVIAEADEDVKAICWTQTSVCGDAWHKSCPLPGHDGAGVPVDGHECDHSYNIHKHDDHWFLFDEIN